MTLIPDRQLRTECFNILVNRFGCLNTERFVAMLNQQPEDYTSWHERHFDNGETVRELGEKVKAFAAEKRERDQARV